MGNTSVRKANPINTIIPLENAMKNELYIFSNPLLISKTGIKNLKRVRKIVRVIIHHLTEFTEEMQ